MKSRIYMIFLRFFLVMALTFSVSAAYDPDIADTVRIDSVTAYPGGGVKLPVYFYNDEPLSAAEVVFMYDSSSLTLDSFSSAGGRLSYIPDDKILTRNSTGLFNLSIQDWGESSWIPRGNGLFCNLYFTVDPTAALQTIIIDSSFYPPISNTVFSDSNAVTIFPQFMKGYITVLESPPSPDSVWIDSVSTTPAETIALNIYGYNEERISGIRLALRYSSDSLEYDTAIFEGTRGETASNKTISKNLQNREILLSLDYNISPLLPGTGILATLKFSTKPGGYNENIIVDSVSYQGIQKLEFIPEGGVGFAPYFRAGHVSIQEVTPGNDTVWVDTTTTSPGDYVDLKVYGRNEKPITDAKLAFKYSSDNLIYDTTIFENTRGDTASNKSVTPDIANKEMLISLGFGIQTPLDPGTGPLAIIRFQIKPEAGNDSIIIDSATFQSTQSLQFAVKGGGSYTPAFRAGFIAVHKPEITIVDSVWVDNVNSAPGKTVTVNINGYNADNLTAVKLALKYSSANLTYVTTVFNSTRGASASVIKIDTSSQRREILISLSYDTSPLSPGSGKLASIRFKIKSPMSDAIVTIDSASFNGTERLEFTPEVGVPFTPYFRSGSINIKNATDVEEKGNLAIPTEFALEQNYPNPFNPSTNIRFDLPKETPVQIDIYNVLGQEVRTLVNRSLPAGVYNITFDGRGDDSRQLASGIYYYRIMAGDFRRSRMMMLLK